MTLQQGDWIPNRNTFSGILWQSSHQQNAVRRVRINFTPSIKYLTVTDSIDGHNGQQVRTTWKPPALLAQTTIPPLWCQWQLYVCCWQPAYYSIPPIQALWLLQQGDRGYLPLHTHGFGRQNTLRLFFWPHTNRLIHIEWELGNAPLPANYLQMNQIPMVIQYPMVAQNPIVA